jgi:uncharacterized YceG family protein
LADDLDWNAIIATGNDAERRARTETGTSGVPQPLSRRAAREARQRQEAAAAETTDGVAPVEPGRPDPRPSVGAAPAGADDELPSDVHALLGGALLSEPAPGSPDDRERARGADGPEQDDRTGDDRAGDDRAGDDRRSGAPVRRRGTWQGVDARDGAAATVTDPTRTGVLDELVPDDDRRDGEDGVAVGGTAGTVGTGVPRDGVPRDGGPTDDGSTDDGSGGGRGGGGRRGGRGGASRPPRGDRPPRRKGPLIAGIVIIAIVLAGAFGAYAFAAPKVQALMGMVAGAKETDDYTGGGTGKVTITIKDGDIGEDVAATLQRSGVVKTSKAFYQLLLSTPEVQFQPGSYALKKKMSSKAALSALQDKSNRVEDPSIVIPEGTALKDIEAGMVSKAGLSKAEVAAAAKDVSAYGLPSGVTTLEGWLFPATYPIKTGWSAKQYFQAMVDTMQQRLDKAGVAEADRERVIVFASLVQKEAGLAADYPKVARVFQNRLDDGMRLQSDATVAYGTGNTHTVTTTDAERADASNPYNTYQHDGLPPAPISNPGDVAINAVVHPASGGWHYFVTVDLETGETAFSDTYEEHLVAVKQFQSWLRAHPDYQ